MRRELPEVLTTREVADLQRLSIDTVKAALQRGDVARL